MSSPVITLTFQEGVAWIKPASFLGGQKFQDYLSATKEGGCTWKPGWKHNTVPVEGVPKLLEHLRIAGFEAILGEDLSAEIRKRAAAAQSQVAESKNRIAKIEAILKERGLSLYPFQRVGVSWLAPRKSGLLADEMGCIDGGALVSFNRAGRGFKVCLADAWRRFHGWGRMNYRWDPKIPTMARSLCDGELRLNRVVDIVNRGVKRCVEITLRSGKRLTCTADHEIATPSGWREAGDLHIGEAVLTNGKRYNVGPKNSHWGGGRSIDSDGYVRIWEPGHPRAHGGQVYEHIVIMEKHLGRPIKWPEQVHHKNHDRADNRISNLEILSASDHHRKHKKHLHLNGGRSIFIPVEDAVVGRRSVGDREVFDIIMADPHRNFVANGVIVHNCGKTIQSLVAIPDNSPVIVVSPATLKQNWKNETLKWRPDMRPEVLAGRGSFRWPGKGEMLIINYDILPEDPLKFPEIDKGDLFQDNRGRSPQEGTVVIADEAHGMKSKRARRTKAFREIAKASWVNDGRVWLLTGTPLLNRPDELWNLLDLGGMAKEAFGHFGTFMRLFSATKGGFGIQWGTPENPEVVKRRLQRVMLARDRKKVLPDLPVKTWEDHPVRLDTATKKLCDQVVSHMEEAGVDWRSDVREVNRRKDGIAFEEMSRVRKALATAKIGEMIDLVRVYEDAGEPVVVFCDHRAPVDTLGTRDGWATITGSTPVSRRAEIVDAFQGGRLKGLALTIAAGGTGITLTKAHQMIFVNLNWTPALNKQAEDRCCRIGQNHGVVITRLVGDHELDHRINEVLHEKQLLIESSVDAARRGNEELDEPESDLKSLDGVKTVKGLKIDKPGEKKSPGIPGSTQANGYFRSHKTDLEKWASDGLLSVAAMDPDRARTENGVGFSKFDNDFGHSLANQIRSGRGLSEKQWACAVRMARKYRRQIGEPPREEGNA